MCSIINVALFIVISIILCVYDIKYYHVPLVPLYIGVVISIVLTFVINKSNLLTNLLGMLCMTLLFLLMRLITKGGMGLGDIQYALYCGFISGFPYFILAALFSSIAGIIIYIIIHKKEKRIPFVPAMLVGSLLSLGINFLYSAKDII